MKILKTAGLVLLGTLITAAAFAAPAVLDSVVYDRAARFLVQNADQWVLNRSVLPHWRLDGGENFTYVKDLGHGRTEFVRVQADTGARSQPFDATIVAQGLTKALGNLVQPDQLPFRDYDWNSAGQLLFTLGDTDYACSITTRGRHAGAATADSRTLVR